MNSALEESKYYVQSYQKISYDETAVKLAILKYGAVAISYVAPTNYYTTKYYSGKSITNHASIIVGWDDSIKNTEFSPSRPDRDGAWIVKNSWGTHGSAKKGVYCYYISYEEPYQKPFVIDMAMREDYPNIYHYDGQIFAGQRNYAVEAQAAIYEAKLSSATKQEQLKAVAIETSQSDLTANVKIYKGLKVNPGNVNDEMNIPVQNEKVAETSARLDGYGMHTIELPEPIALKQGEYFSVIVSCKSDFGSIVPVVCAGDNRASVNDMTYYLYNGKWNSYKSSVFYADTSNDNMTARIRAITTVADRDKNLGNDLKFARVEVKNRLVDYEKGNPSIPELEVFFDGKLLVQGQDYTVEIKNNDKIGMATITILGKGSYKGTRTTYFEVAKPKFPPGIISGTIDVYNDVVNLYDITLPSGWQWINTNQVLKNGRSEYKYSIKYVGEDKDLYQNTACDFYVNKLDQDPPDRIDITSAEVEIIGEYVYTGKQIVPNVKVTLNGTVLREGVDFTLSLENCMNAGEAKVTVQGKGRYAGKISKTFEIKKAQWPQERPSGTIRIGSNITNLSQVALNCKNWEWERNLAITSDQFLATAIYTGQDKNNYVNTQVQITITRSAKQQMDIASVELELKETSFLFDGEEKTPDVFAKDGSKNLVKGADFDVTYQDNVFAGQASVTVSGKNSYMGSKTLTFTIEKAERKAFSVSHAGWTYGEQNTPTPSVSGEMESADVTYSYSTEENGTFTSQKPTDAGTYWVKAEIAPSQNYNAAAAKAKFSIAQAEHPSKMPAEFITVAREIQTLQSIELISGWHWEDQNVQMDAETVQAWAVYFDEVNYKTCRVQITITKEPPKDVKELSISLESDNFVYDTTLKTPEVFVKDGLKTLINGTDFDVEYQNNVFAGQGKVIVTFKNDYKGTREFTFTISQAEMPRVDTTIHYDKRTFELSDIPLPEGFVWEEESAEISSEGMTAKAIYKGEDAGSFKTCELTFEIIMGEQTQPQKRESFPYLAIAIPAAVLLVAGMGFAIVVVCKRKKK